MSPAAVVPDFRAKARVEADRAFDDMTRLAAEEADRVAAEHHRALELALDEVNRQGHELNALMTPPPQPYWQDPIFMLVALVLNNLLVGLVALAAATVIFGLGGGGGRVEMQGLQVATPAFPPERASAALTKVRSGAQSSVVSVRPRFDRSAALEFGSKQPRYAGGNGGAYTLTSAAAPDPKALHEGGARSSQVVWPHGSLTLSQDFRSGLGAGAPAPPRLAIVEGADSTRAFSNVHMHVAADEGGGVRLDGKRPPGAAADRLSKRTSDNGWRSALILPPLSARRSVPTSVSSGWVAEFPVGLHVRPAKGANAVLSSGHVSRAGLRTVNLGVGRGWIDWRGGSSAASIGFDKPVSSPSSGAGAVATASGASGARGWASVRVNSKTRFTGGLVVQQGGMKMPIIAHTQLFEVRKDENHTCSIVLKEGTLKLKGGAKLGDHYRDVVRTQGVIEVVGYKAGAPNTLVRLWALDSADGSMRASGRLLGLQSRLLGKVTINDALTDRLTVAGRLLVNSNAELRVKGGCRLGFSDRHNAANNGDVVIRGHVSVRSDSWHEMLTINTVKDDPRFVEVKMVGSLSALQNGSLLNDTIFGSVKRGDPSLTPPPLLPREARPLARAISPPARLAAGSEPHSAGRAVGRHARRSVAGSHAHSPPLLACPPRRQAWAPSRSPPRARARGQQAART